MMNRLLLIGMVCCLCLVAVSATAARPVAPLVWKVVQIDRGLKSEGGTLKLELALTKNPKVTDTGKYVLSPSFADGWGRVFWTGEAIPITPGDAANPATVEFTIPYPPLPVGGYLFRGLVRDAAGAEVQTVWVPTGRFEKFDFRRDLVWFYWGGWEYSDEVAKKLLQLGINGGDRDYRFPYRYFRDHAAHKPLERYPEDVVRHREGTGLDWYRDWVGPADPDLVLALMTDEMTVNTKDPAMRAANLRLMRADRFLNVPTVSRFNQVYKTDFLSWDEALRDGFGGPAKTIRMREFSDVEVPSQRMAVLRETQPQVAFSPGATHCLYDGIYDSFNSRAYNQETTLDIANVFVNSQTHYGLRPGNKLIQLRVGLYRGDELLGVIGQLEHAFWASLACNNRMFIIYGPGDGYGAAPVSRDGQVTADGRYFQELRRTIHGLRPVILETRTRVDPAVLMLMNHYNGGERNFVEGLINCGVMPRGGLRPDDATRLIFAIKAPLDTAMPMRAPGGLDPLVAAVQRGAGLVLQGNYPKELARLGIEVPVAAASATGDAGAKAAEEIDLSPLATFIPGLAGVKVLGTWGPGAKAAPASGYVSSYGFQPPVGSCPELQEIRSGDTLLALTGTLGKGWVLFLNFELQEMFRENGMGGARAASQLSLVVDPTIPDRNAAFVRALLARAGVPERLRCTDAKGRIHPYLRAFRAETYDTRQEYLYIVSEAAGKLVPDPDDPKKQVVALASEPQVSGRLRIFDPAVKAVHDLRAKKRLPVQTDAQGAWVDLTLEAGQGTILSLLPAEPAGTLALHLSQGEVAGTEQIQVELQRLDAAGNVMELPGHSLWVRFLDPQGQEVEPLTRWATGGGPHLFTIPFALNDPNGEWTVVADDMTDGTSTEEKLPRQAKPAGPRQAFVPSSPPARAPYAVTLESTPYLDGDLILTEIRGTLKCAAAGATPVTIRLPAGPAGAAREVTVTSPKAHAEVPFAIPLWMTRAQAQAVCGPRYEGIELTVEAPGLPVERFRYVPNILPLARAPQRLGWLTGGKAAVKVNNFTKAEQRVAITLATLPGENGKAWQTGKTVAPQSSEVLERVVTGLPALPDPGLYDVALEWRVGEAAQAAAALPIEAVAEQEWWIKTVNPLDGVKLGEIKDTLAPAGETMALDESKGEPAPELPDTPPAREKAGWRRVMTQGVVWWADVTPPEFGFGRIYAVTQVIAPEDTGVRITFFGPTTPGLLWVNGALAATGAEAVPVALRKGRNTVGLALDLTGKNPLRVVERKGRTPPQPGCSLALLNPATGKRDRSLQIGAPLGAAAGGK